MIGKCVPALLPQCHNRNNSKMSIKYSSLVKYGFSCGTQSRQLINLMNVANGNKTPLGPVLYKYTHSYGLQGSKLNPDFVATTSTVAYKGNYCLYYDIGIVLANTSPPDLSGMYSCLHKLLTAFGVCSESNSEFSYFLFRVCVVSFLR